MFGGICLSYARIEGRGRNHLTCNEVSDEFPLVINVFGEMNIPTDFDTYNPTGRSDFYFMYMIKGELELFSSGDWVRIGAGNVVVFYPEKEYRYRNVSGEPIFYYFVHYTGRDALEVTQSCGFVHSVPKNIGVRERLFKHIEAISEECLRKNENYFIRLSAELTALLVDASRYFTESKAKRLYNSIEYLSKNFAAAPDVNELAAMEHLSTGRYRCVFSELMGMSPKEYIIRLRLDRSMELLQCTDLSVGEISDIVGYQDPLYFSKLFKRKLGVSPAAYRKGNK